MLPEQLVSRLPESIKGKIPQRTRSLEQFAQISKDDRSTVVDVKVDEKAGWRGAKSKVVGRLGEWNYTLEFSTTLKNGRKLIYREVTGRRYGSERGVGDMDNREKMAMDSIGTAYAEMETLAKQLPPFPHTKLRLASTFGANTFGKTREEIEGEISGQFKDFLEQKVREIR